MQTEPHQGLFRRDTSIIEAHGGVVNEPRCTQAKFMKISNIFKLVIASVLPGI